MSLIARDNFPGSTLSSDWVQYSGSYAVGSNIVTATANGSPSPKNVLIRGTQYYPDCLVSVQVGPNYLGATHVGGPLARITIDGGALSCLQMIYKPPSKLLQTVWVSNNTAGNDIFDTGAGSFVYQVNAGDLMSLQCVGNVLTMFVNGIQVATVTDTVSDRVTGSVGMNVVSTGSNYGMQNWSASNLSGFRARPGRFWRLGR